MRDTRKARMMKSGRKRLWTAVESNKNQSSAALQELVGLTHYKENYEEEQCICQCLTVELEQVRPVEGSLVECVDGHQMLHVNVLT